MKLLNLRGIKWSGREDLNLRPPGPEPGALPGCATPRLTTFCSFPFESNILRGAYNLHFFAKIRCNRCNWRRQLEPDADSLRHSLAKSNIFFDFVI